MKIYIKYNYENAFVCLLNKFNQTLFKEYMVSATLGHPVCTDFIKYDFKIPVSKRWSKVNIITWLSSSGTAEFSWIPFTMIGDGLAWVRL